MFSLKLLSLSVVLYFKLITCFLLPGHFNFQITSKIAKILGIVSKARHFTHWDLLLGLYCILFIRNSFTED